MKENRESIPHKAALISVPWPIYNRPSIQLGALKAYLKKGVKGIDVSNHHFYLNVAEKLGYKYYHAISESSWLAETVYAAILYPERHKTVEALYRRLVSGKRDLKGIGFDEIVRVVKETSDTLIDSVEWGRNMFIGVSVCLCQLTSSLYFIRRIREAYPDVTIAAGGSVISGMNPSMVLNVFPEIDCVVTGEGETALAELAKQLINKEEAAQRDVPGLSFRGKNHSRGFSQVTDLDSLPIPDYGDYYKTLAALPPSKRFFPTLPAEMSRGCWWHRTVPGTKDSGCAFCNLNLQWAGYRSKSPERISREVDYLTSAYKTLSVAFMDNALPVKKSGRMFERIRALNKDLSFFCEIRAAMTFEQLETMKRAGCRNLQVGIESLSSSLLHKLNKGTTAIENLEVMKHCEALGIINNSNLIIHFPGSEQDEVDETLECLEYAMVFRPMKTVSFQLGLGSPVMNNLKEYGIKTAFNHLYYKALFPESVETSLRFPSQAYKADMGEQKRLWKPVEKTVRTWQDMYEKLHREKGSDPILSYRDGREFLIIKKRNYGTDNETHRLTGASRKIYLYCNRRRTLSEVKAEFKGITGDAIYSFLSMMTDKRLMFEEDGSYLSLAVPLMG